MWLCVAYLHLYVRDYNLYSYLIVIHPLLSIVQSLDYLQWLKTMEIRNPSIVTRVHFVYHKIDVQIQ